MNLTRAAFLKARDFILTNARMIERRLFHYHFENDTPKGVYHAVYAYRNEDGGFGHGMEPDTSSPESQALFSVMALETLDEVGLLSAKILEDDFMPYFKSITTERGGIPWMQRPLNDYPCADHFKSVDERAALSTTAPLLGMLEKYKVEDKWMEGAENFVWEEIERIQKRHVFCHLCVPRRMTFLENVKDRSTALKAIEDLGQWILEEGVLSKDRSEEGWGLYGKPHSLCYAPSPDSTLNSIFSLDTINADLEELIRRQEEDGRWDTWYGLSEGMKLEWAGIQTLWTLRTLKNYGRIEGL